LRRGPQPTLLRVRRSISFHVRVGIRTAGGGTASRRPLPCRAARLPTCDHCDSSWLPVLLRLHTETACRHGGRSR
jgi:hypothetical protein